MLDELQRRNYAKTTVQYYIQAVERFAKHFHRSPDQLNRTPPPRVSGLPAARPQTRAADGEASRLGAPVLLREDPEAAVPARRHPVSEGAASPADHPDRGGSHPIDRRRPHADGPHDADGAVFHGDAERGDAEPAGEEHRQSVDADSHRARQRRSRSVRPAQSRRCWRPCACTGAG